MIKQSIIDIIGNTPLIRTRNIELPRNIELYIKMEGVNIGGSAKIRSAYNIIINAFKEGTINKDSTIIESSSGNFGIAMAIVCCFFGLKFICVCDAKTTSQNIKIMKAYGATIEIVNKRDKKTNEYLPVRLERVQELLHNTPKGISLDQYKNINNPRGHECAMEEIADELNNDVDYIFCAVSTFGTIRGYADYIRKNNLKTKIIAIDAVGSVLFDNTVKKRLIPGHGAASKSELFDKSIVNDYILVDDLECVKGCRFLIKKEGILAGGSTGGIISAILKYQSEIKSNAKCVFVMHDRGESYLDTIYSNQWVAENFGNVVLDII